MGTTKITCSDTDTDIMEARTSMVQLRNDRAQITHDENFTATNVIWKSSSPKRFFQADWRMASADITSFQTLDFRVSRQRDKTERLEVNDLNPTETTNFAVQLVMVDGSVSGTVSLSNYIKLKGPVGVRDLGGITGPDGEIGQLHPVLNTVRIPLTDFVGADLSQVAGVRFVFNDTKTGAIFLSNVIASK